MRLIEVPEWFQEVEIFDTSEHEHQIIVTTSIGIYIVTEDNVWLRCKTLGDYGGS